MDPTHAAIGYFGKVPARGDFVRAGLPASFIGPWDTWLRAALAQASGRLGGAWQARFLRCPVWRFALAPGVCDAEGWMGVLASSADGVGRLYPLTVALPAPEGDPAQLIDGWTEGFEQLIDAALTMIAGEAGFSSAATALAEVVARHPLPTLRAVPPPEAVLQPGEAVRIPALAPGMALAAVCTPVLAHASPRWTVMWRSGWGLPSAAVVAHGLADPGRGPTIWDEWDS